MSRTTWVTVLIVLVAISLAFVLHNSQAEAPDATESVSTRVDVVRLKLQSLPGVVRADGFLRAQHDVTIAAERAGRVTGLPVAEGRPVQQGDVVAQLDATVAEANVVRARAVAREIALQPTASAAERARADEALRLAEHELALRQPRAPFAGVVEVHHVDPGEYVQPGMPLVDVVDARVLVLDVDVDAELVGSLAVGDEVRTVAPAAGGALRTGRITRLATRADARTRRFRVEVSLTAKGSGFKPGMHAEARFGTPGGEPAHYLPKAATRAMRGQTGAYVVRDGVARWVPVDVVEVYHRPDLWRLAPGAIKDGETVVVAGFGGLRDGMKVEVGP